MGRDCLILGSGRSGTSLAAGMLAGSGYFMGEELWPGNHGNPRGYFEDREVNSINEELLEPFTPTRPLCNFLRSIRSRKHEFHRWLALVPPGVPIFCPPLLAQRIQAVTHRRPFCFKDPRFCYTLPVWRPYVDSAALICVFRDPGVTANSILSECRRAKYLKHVKMDFQRALTVWEAMYRHVLEGSYPAGGDWLFLHYDQLLNGTAASRIESLLQTTVNTTFGDPALKRSTCVDIVPQHVMHLYEQLCTLAHFTDERTINQKKSSSSVQRIGV
jgi:hypothetical protein